MGFSFPGQNFAVARMFLCEGSQNERFLKSQMLHDTEGNLEPKGRVELHCHSTSFLEMLRGKSFGYLGWYTLLLYDFSDIQDTCCFRPEARAKNNRFSMILAIVGNI